MSSTSLTSTKESNIYEHDVYDIDLLDEKSKQKKNECSSVVSENIDADIYDNIIYEKLEQNIFELYDKNLKALSMKTTTKTHIYGESNEEIIYEDDPHSILREFAIRDI